MPVEGSKLLSDMAARLGGLEQRVAELADALGEVKDLELVNKLDLLNLANQLERVRMTTPGVAEAAQKGDELGKLEQAVAGLEADVSQLKSGGGGESGIAARVEALGQRLALLERAGKAGMARMPAPAGDRCASCGAQARGGARFCGTCGAAMVPPHLAYKPAALDAGDLRQGLSSRGGAKAAAGRKKGLLHRRVKK